MGYDPAEARDDHGRWTSGGSSGLSESESSSLRLYTATETKAAFKLNSDLRSGTPLGQGDQQVVKDLDGLVSSHTMTEDQVVYRGLGGKMSGTLYKLREGDILSQKGFSSTTKDINVAKVTDFGPDYMEIRVPKGSHAFDMAHYYTSGSETASEKEVLLGRGAKLKYTGRGRGMGNVSYMFDLVR